MEIAPANAEGVVGYDALGDDRLAGWDPEGDPGRRLLLNPAIFDLLGEVRGRRVLDAGCGQGYLSRLLADRGASVVGVDASHRLLAYAEALEARRAQGIEYLQRDLSRLGEVGGPFDAVVANMVLLDIADWRPALANCVGALRPGGRLVYSLLHPCWVSGASSRWQQVHCVELREYLNEYEVPGGEGGGPNYHRPLSSYLNETIGLGCTLVELVEPVLAPEAVENPDQEILVHIPNFVVVAAERHTP